MDTNTIASLLAALAARPAPVTTASQTAFQIVQMVLTALGPLLAGVAAYIASKATKNTADAKQEIVILKEHINSRMTELLKASGESQHAAGLTAGRSQAGLLPVTTELDDLRQALLVAKDEISLLQKQVKPPPPKS